jgi:hypothetical protein
MKRNPTVLVIVLGFAAFQAFGAEFEADVLPMLKSKCGKCHMDGNAKGDLSLDAAEISKVIGSGKAIVPGDVKKSDLMDLVSLPEDDEDRMPPVGKGTPLAAGDIEKLKEWIEAGALVGGAAPPTTEGEKKPGTELGKRPDPIDGKWTNVDGKVITATLLRVEGTNAVLRMDGKEFPYPIAKLSAGDQAKIRSFDEATKKASGG